MRAASDRFSVVDARVPSLLLQKVVSNAGQYKMQKLVM